MEAQDLEPRWFEKKLPKNNAGISNNSGLDPRTLGSREIADKTGIQSGERKERSVRT